MPISDDQALALLPEVREFIQAVAERDPAFVEVCIKHSGARALAVWSAEFAGIAQDRIAELTAENQKLSRNYVDQRERVIELRKLLDAKAAASTANHKTKSKEAA